MNEPKLQTGIVKSTGIQKKSKRLQKKPKRKKPKYDFEEGIRIGYLASAINNIEAGINKPASGIALLASGLSLGKAFLKELVENYSYGAEDILEILQSSGIKNPNFMIEYIMNEGEIKDRECEIDGCPVILTPYTLIHGNKCSRHMNDKDE